MPDVTPTDSSPETTEVKFVVSKQVRSVLVHTAIPLLCTVVFNAVRVAKPDLLWSPDMDQEAVGQIVSLVNDVLIAISAIMAAVGSARDVNNFRKAKKAADAEPVPPSNGQ